TGDPRHLFVRGEHRLLPPAHEPGEVRRRGEGDSRLHLVALLRLLADRCARDSFLSNPRARSGDPSAPLLALRERIVLALLAELDARGDECVARGPPRWRLPVQRRNRRTRLSLSESESQVEAGPHP